MRRFALSVFAVAALLLAASCSGLNMVTQADLETQPTTYAKVIKEPDPLLFGHWRRPQPPGINRPWMFSYAMIRKGDKIAVYYFYDSRKKNSFKGWADFTVDGDTLVSGVDGSTFYVKDGDVYMKVAGRDTPYRMEKVD